MARELTRFSLKSSNWLHSKQNPAHCSLIHLAGLAVDVHDPVHHLAAEAHVEGHGAGVPVFVGVRRRHRGVHRSIWRGGQNEQSVPVWGLENTETFVN